ncbi:trifunctional glycosyltransferase/class I SAM-dependent methyltransferase/polysaccharide deacetylase [Bradyrhizobium lablabi]|uniref:trifunctional glycosyltransferase/class I SAM-dependent methyltransferase/polysaccharide deacetylase n=1 Tax=Bradyrhizobium lablabi TaxID=722472 RepID=UPI001BA5C2D1|nr:trifunctional glycosyltransferase/class I SAM-dependent methyltransferase/polysaccharide deacetylase [Bradyrhizobium lablabi]MBR0697914.1 glycosyltransferase [Bradyrhizobium lablabi]
MTAGSLTSIVIAARDAEKTIARTLESLLAQSAPRWEALIVDDGSVDATPAIVDGYAARDARFIALKSIGRGVSTARNVGLSRANGERILFLDSDDWIDAQFLAKMNAALDENPSAIAACCDHCRVMPDGGQTPRYRNAVVANNPFEAFARSCPVAVHGVLVKKSAVQEVGGFDVDLRTCEEWDLWQRIARSGGRWIHVDELLSYYWSSEHSLSSDVQQMLVDGNAVITRGFSTDARVQNPAPTYRNGASAAHGRPLAAARAYFALWCCGIDCARGKWSLPSTELLTGIPQSETAADQIAFCLLDALAVGARTTPARLAGRWAQFGARVTELIAAIGQAWSDPAAARKVQYRFERVLLDYDDLSAPRELALTLGLRVDLRQLPELCPPSHIDRLYVYICDGPEVLALFDVGVLGTVDSDFWTKLVDEHLGHLEPPAHRPRGLQRQSRPAKLIRRLREFARSNPDSHQYRLQVLQDRMLRGVRSRPASSSPMWGNRQNHAFEDSPSEIGRELFWERFFQKEDPWNYGSPYEQEKYQRQLELLPPEPAERAMELACAEGHFSQQLAGKVGHLLAFDISSTALERAGLRCSGIRNVEFHKLDLSADPLPGEMDLICCSEVLYFLNDETELALVAEKVARALRPGGHLITAHSFVLNDDKSRTGFDWENQYGAGTIARVMARLPDLALESSIQTDLYRVDRYRRPKPGEVAPDPQVTFAPIAAPIEREVARFIVRNGAVRRRSEVRQSERRTHVPVLMYHRIATDGPEALARYRVNPDTFAEQMLWLRRNGYHTINSEQLAWFVANDYSFEGRPLLITFDDGYEDFAEQAWPILKANDLSAEVFIVTDLAGGRAEWDRSFGTPAPLMDADRIVALAGEGAMFGSHLARHPRSDRLSSSELAEELLRSRLQLETWLGRPTTSLAAPFGCTDQRFRILAAECGYKAVFNTVDRAAGLKDDLLDLPRIEVRGDHSLEAFVHCLEQYQ